MNPLLAVQDNRSFGFNPTGVRPIISRIRAYDRAAGPFLDYEPSDIRNAILLEIEVGRRSNGPRITDSTSGRYVVRRKI